MNQYFDKAASTWDQDPMKIERSELTAECCKKFPLKSKKRLLDFGGGTGLLSFFLYNSFDQITIADTSKEMLMMAQKKIKEAKITNIETLKIDRDISEINKKFSAIITLMTLHHIPKVQDFLYNASNLLEDDGVLMVADLYKEDGAFHKHDPDFNGHNGFEVNVLSQEIKNAGFSVSQIINYYEIEKEMSPGKSRRFPLFFLVAEK